MNRYSSLLDGINQSYSYTASNPLRFTDSKGLILGTIAAKIGQTLFGLDRAGSAVGGKVADSIIGGVVTALNDRTNCGCNNIGNLLNALQLVGGIQTSTLAPSLAYGFYGAGASVPISSAGAGVAGPAALVTLAGLGGYEIGGVINNVYECLSGQTIGADIYDKIHGDTRLF